jgi:hypothetical protein
LIVETYACRFILKAIAQNVRFKDILILNTLRCLVIDQMVNVAGNCFNVKIKETVSQKDGEMRPCDVCLGPN